jgi:hypothetical protein
LLFDISNHLQPIAESRQPKAISLPAALPLRAEASFFRGRQCRGRKQPVAFDRNLSSSQKQEDFELRNRSPSQKHGSFTRVPAEIKLNRGTSGAERILELTP